MPYLIGMDEAGYGPNLGPLLISVSAWRIPGKPDDTDLYDELSDAVGPAGVKPDKIAIADSKQLYKSRGSLDGLERAVFPALSMLGKQPRDWQAVWESLAGPSGADQQDLPWYRDYNEQLPRDTDRQQLRALTQRLEANLQSRNIELAALRSAAVFPEQFNRLTGQLGSKGATLTSATLQLLADVLTALPPDEMLIVCDKHGGRNHYVPALQQQFPEYLIEVRQESRPLSVYRWGPSQRRTEIRFQAKGEQFLAAALASLASKYLRELAMRAFNAFWCQQTPQLRPTAGYPNDAKRFRRDIAHAQSNLGISSDILWRVK